MPRDSCQVSRPEGEQGCTFPSLFSVQKISDVPDIEDLHLIEQPALGMLTISIFPLCLLPGDYVRQVIIILARVKAREKKKQNKPELKRKYVPGQVAMQTFLSGGPAISISVFEIQLIF